MCETAYESWSHGESRRVPVIINDRHNRGSHVWFCIQSCAMQIVDIYIGTYWIFYLFIFFTFLQLYSFLYTVNVNNNNPIILIVYYSILSQVRDSLSISWWVSLQSGELFPCCPFDSRKCNPPLCAFSKKACRCSVRTKRKPKNFKNVDYLIFFKLTRYFFY